MTPIPEAAMPVVRIIREQVPRPKRLPFQDGDKLRWKRKREGLIVYFCPMGLLPGAKFAIPISGYGAGLPDEMYDAISCFGSWWDGLSDAQEAVDAVWGKA